MTLSMRREDTQGGANDGRLESARRVVDDVSRCGAAGVAGAQPARAQVSVPWSIGTEIAKTKAPANATDCHHHIYSSRFKIDPTSVLRPGDASVADYHLLQKRTGTSRNVVVQPSTYGVFNDGLVEALGEFGPTARGVAVVNTSVTDDELKRLDTARVRGIRFNLATGGATTVDMIEPLAKRIAPLGWHIQMNCVAAVTVDNKDLFNRLPCPSFGTISPMCPSRSASRIRCSASSRTCCTRAKPGLKLSGAYADTMVGPPSVLRLDRGGTGLCQGSAGAPGVGQRLAASVGKERQQAGRRAAVRLARGLGAERSDAQPHPGRQSGEALRLWVSASRALPRRVPGWARRFAPLPTLR
jgi:hypothetical protein